MLFIRDFAGFTGGHLKFADYIRHTEASGIAEPVLYQTSRSRAVPGNIFNEYNGLTIDELRAFPAYFVAGEDWFVLDSASIDPGPSPVVNLIQGFRHAEPADPLFGCLARPALRICVSPAVAEAIRNYVNGEVHVIENGVEVDAIPDKRPLAGLPRILIAGFKNPDVARAIAARLDCLVQVDLVLEQIPRPAFLARIAASSICIMLPLEREGFFLPPLEAMALGRGVVTPDCGGNRAYCRPGENCLIMPYDADAIAAAALALAHDQRQLERLVAGGLRTAAQASIDRERVAYQTLLARYLAR
jgi:glycosyltransferase involved in cell wall biosynthesis